MPVSIFADSTLSGNWPFHDVVFLGVIVITHSRRNLGIFI